MFKENRVENSLKHNNEGYKCMLTRNKEKHDSRFIFTHNKGVTWNS